MQDLLPAQKETYRAVEDVAREVLAAYGYSEIGLPALEQTRKPAPSAAASATITLRSTT